MRPFLVLFFLFAGIATFAQPALPIVYKTSHDRVFNLGDRITIGEMDIPEKYTDFDSIHISIPLDDYRDVIQENPLITFRLNMYWKQQGIKYPGRSDDTRDSMLHELNKRANPADPANGSISHFKHIFLKQKETLKMELEVIAIAAQNRVTDPINATGVIALPEMNVLYRNYDNKFSYAIPGIPADHDTVWVEGKGVTIQLIAPGQGIIRVTGIEEQVSLRLVSCSDKDPVEHGTFVFNVMDLPSESGHKE